MRDRFYKLADYYAQTLYGEFGFDTCKHDEQQIILTKVLRELGKIS